MTECERLSDRMPEVALGRAAWTAEEETHLDSCDECRAEWALVQGAGHLGESLPPGDPEVLAAAVLGRLAEERAAARTRRRAWLAAGLAAAAVAIIAVRIPRPPTEVAVPVPAVPAAPAATVPGVATAGQAVALPELDDLPDAELESILGSLDESPGTSPALDDPGFDDLDEHELERVLGAWEG